MVRDNSHTRRFCLPQSFFSRRAKYKNSEAQSISGKDYEAAENEEALATLRNEALEHIQPKHPVMCDGHNLCELVTSQKLSILKIGKLSEICRLLKLEVPGQQGKRKAPFLGALTPMVSECSATTQPRLLWAHEMRVAL